MLYKGHGGLVAHECILDLRGLTKATGVTVDDVAKRLVDYGFHAPTMSFPVAGTLMVEPTESEDLAEIDRFCDAMIAIRAEIEQVERGEWSVDKSPLRGAPHTARAIVGDWDRAYPREVAVFPTGPDPDKYWPPVARIDQAYGDRHLVCSCPPPEAFAEAVDASRSGPVGRLDCSVIQSESPYSGRAPTPSVRPRPPDDLAGHRRAGGGPGDRRCPSGALRRTDRAGVGDDPEHLLRR